MKLVIKQDISVYKVRARKPYFVFSTTYRRETLNGKNILTNEKSIWLEFQSNICHKE